MRWIAGTFWPKVVGEPEAIEFRDGLLLGDVGARRRHGGIASRQLLRHLGRLEAQAERRLRRKRFVSGDGDAGQGFRRQKAERGSGVTQRLIGRKFRSRGYFEILKKSFLS